ncbi:hypothetical protein VNI00_013894 [Paramarasmius palmivorus]|uniref:Uncharacterized protein n=1 Tax=Paramarasmius palmivorus TaxID=297713 RepID=A0AAW0BW02_9AGAR
MRLGLAGILIEKLLIDGAIRLERMMTGTLNRQLYLLVIISRHGDRIHYFQDPKTYKGFFTKITPLGLAESFQLGTFLHSTYLNPRSASHIEGIRSDLVDSKQLQVFSKNGGEGNVVFDSAIATLQGLFPPNPRNRVTLANGTTVVAPFDGYQYIPVETVEPVNDRLLEPWTHCPAFQRHIREFYSSPEFRAKARESRPFLDFLRPFVFGRPTNLVNAWNIFDFINTQFTYNETYAEQLPPGVLGRIRSLADFHENGVFSDRRPFGIGNIASRTLMHLIITALERMGHCHDPLKLTLIETGYQPFISFFHEIEADRQNPELEAIPDFSSIIAIELHESGHRRTLQFKFKNGTESGFEPIQAYGHRGGIPLEEFILRAKPGVISNNREWARVCGVRGVDDVAEPVLEWANYDHYYLAVALLLAVLLFVRWVKGRTSVQGTRSAPHSASEKGADETPEN